MSALRSFPECDYVVSMADGHLRVGETDEAFERTLASKIARLVAEETQTLRAALEASKLECEALRKRAAKLEACLASRLAEEKPAIPGLPNHLVVSHILGSDKLNDPADLVRLTAVSRGMRAAVAATKRAVAATKLTVKEPTELEAVHKGYLTTLKHMHSRGRLSHKENLCVAAASSGRLEELKSLRAEKWPWDEETCAYAAGGGHLEVLKWARASGCPWNAATCKSASWGGHLEVLKWAREHGCPWNRLICADAAYRGNLEMLKWARENGCPWDEETCMWAARGGHLEVLQWACENGCPWDLSACKYAAMNGHLAVLQWARENDCPWDENLCMYAAKGGHLQMLRWLRENGAPWFEETPQLAAQRWPMF